MKIRLLIILPILTFNYYQIFAQYSFPYIPLSGDVSFTETIESRSSRFDPKEKMICMYENGKVKSVQHFKGKKLLIGTLYEYALSNKKEIIKEINPDKTLGATTINYFDKGFPIKN